MKKAIAILAATTIAFSSSWQVSSFVNEENQVAHAKKKTTKQLKADGKKKILKYLYSAKPEYKKADIRFEYFEKQKNGDLYYEVYEFIQDDDEYFHYTKAGFFYLTKKSNYKYLYEDRATSDSRVLVKKFKK